MKGGGGGGREALPRQGWLSAGELALRPCFNTGSGGHGVLKCRVRLLFIQAVVPAFSLPAILAGISLPGERIPPPPVCLHTQDAGTRIWDEGQGQGHRIVIVGELLFAPRISGPLSSEGRRPYPYSYI